MKKLLLFILVMPFINSCEDPWKKNSLTIVKGYVIDKLTNQKVANARIYLLSCKYSLRYCSTILDSTFSDSQGYYEYRFKNKLPTECVVTAAKFTNNEYVYISSTDEYQLQNNFYKIIEGKTNEFNIHVLPFKTLKMKLKLQNTAFEDVVIYSHSAMEEITLKNKANNLDTTLYFKAIPLITNYFSLRLDAADKPSLPLGREIYVSEADTTELEIIK